MTMVVHDNFDPGVRWRYFILILLSVIFQSLVMVFSKLAALGEISRVYELYLNVYFILMLGCLLAQGLFWTLALKYFTLSYAYPMLSMSLVFNAVFAVVIFGEKYNGRSLLGLSCIVVGVALLLKNKGKSNA